MKKVIKEKDLRKANNTEKANMLKRIAQGQAVYEKTKKELSYR